MAFGAEEFMDLLGGEGGVGFISDGDASADVVVDVNFQSVGFGDAFQQARDG